jgi:glycerophosphoryl diester phosphodiesterase
VLHGQRPLVFAHRGGAALAPENTLEAFGRGLAVGADGLEMDLRLSRDGVVFVLHDATLHRTTDGRGPIAGLTADEIGRLDAGYHHAPDQGFPWRGRGLRIPRLRDVLARFPRVPVILELKVNSPDLATAAIEDIRAANAVEHVCFGGFAMRVMRAARGYEPRIPTGAAREEVRWALYRSWIGWSLGSGGYRAFQVPERAGRTRVVSPRFIQAAHAAGLVVQVWTVNDTDDMRRLLDWGADGLITDRPDLAASIVRERAAETDVSEA